MEERKYRRGQIYYVYPDGFVVGCEQRLGRPAIIVSNDIGNEHSEMVEIVPLTTKHKKPLPTHTTIHSLKRPSTALCEQVQTVSKQRLGKYMGQIEQAEIEEMEQALLVSLGIYSRVNNGKALELWRKMMESDAGEAADEDGALDLSAMKEQINAKSDFGKSSAAYIRMKAERDVLKEMYVELLNKIGKSGGMRNGI